MSIISNILKSTMMVIGGSLLAFGASAQFDPVLLCGGTQHLRSNSNQVVRSSYSFRNYHPTETRNIKYVKVFDATGAIRCDYPNVDPFPADFRSVLPPHASARLVTRNMDVCHNPVVDLPSDLRPLQVVIAWSSADKQRYPLVGNYSTRLIDADSSRVMSERSSRCETESAHREN